MMKKSNGYFVISLDFELHWGVFDKRSISDYQENLENVKLVVPRLLKMADDYNIKFTFATVGFLFAENKAELLENSPKLLPSYTNPKFSPYNILEGIGYDETDDQYHYASTLIDQIKKTNKHEIGTHTYSHYYCLEDGQTEEQFEADLVAAMTIAKKKNISIKSIAFPRNQVKPAYLYTCKKHGITAYRGIEKHKIYNTLDKDYKKKHTRALRLLDAYFKISGYNTYKISEINKERGLVNIPSSCFLRPYSKSLRHLDTFRISRVKKAMSYAAKNNEIYHLWWHPHNFGTHMNENFSALESIFDHYLKLNNEFHFKNVTMQELVSYS
ncbi:MAG TPA: polysaccharide deacetylase family protein [Xanthomarina sp.]|nr:polysaccharide deacetylase family protein [Xanthomarina sp.]